METRWARSRVSSRTTALSSRVCSTNFPSPSSTPATASRRWVESYEAIRNSLDEVAQQQGVRDTVDRAAEQAYELVEEIKDAVTPVAKVAAGTRLGQRQPAQPARR